MRSAVQAGLALGTRGQSEDEKRQTQPKPDASSKPTTKMKVHILTLVQRSSTLLALNVCNIVAFGNPGHEGFEAALIVLIIDRNPVIWRYERLEAVLIGPVVS